MASQISVVEMRVSYSFGRSTGATSDENGIPGICGGASIFHSFGRGRDFAGIRHSFGRSGKSGRGRKATEGRATGGKAGKEGRKGGQERKGRKAGVKAGREAGREAGGAVMW